MTGSEPTDSTRSNPWFDTECGFPNSQPTETDIAEIRFDPSDPDALHRLLQALRKL